MLREGSEKDEGKLRECEKIARKLRESSEKVTGMRGKPGISRK